MLKYEKKKKNRYLSVSLIGFFLLALLMVAHKWHIFTQNTLCFLSFSPHGAGTELNSNMLLFPLTLLITIGVFSITKGKDNNEDALKKIKSKEKGILGSLADDIPVFLIGINEDGTTQYINKTMLDATGYQEREVLGKDYLKQFVPPKQYEKTRVDLPNFPKTDRPLYNDNILLTKDGKELWVRWYGVPIYDNAGNFQYHLGLVIDITAQRKLESELEKQRKIEHLLLETVPTAIFFRDKEGKIVYANRQAEKLLHVQSGELTGKLISELKWGIFDMDENPVPFGRLPWIKTKEQGKPIYGSEHILKGHEGGKTVVSISVAPIIDEEGVFQGSVGSFSDITKQKLEEQERERLFLLEKEHSNLIALGNEMIYNLISKQDFAAQLEKFLEFVTKVLPHDGADISLLVENHLKVIALQGYEGETCQNIVKNLRHDLNLFPLEREVIQSKEPVIIPYTSQDPRWVVIPGLEWIRSAVKIPLVFEEEVLGTLGITKREVNAFTEESIKKIESFIHGLSIALHNHTSYKQLHKTRNDTILAMTKLVEIRDPYTSGHQEEISHLAVAIAEEMGLDKDTIETIRISALVHDIGKITVPSEILNKPGKLTEMEFGIIKNHSRAGYEILKDISFTSPIAQIVFQHHEKLDGSGYPRGLKGDEIMLEARIILVADVYEAMSSHRPHRPALNQETVERELEKNKNLLYDPIVVEALLKVIKK